MAIYMPGNGQVVDPGGCALPTRRKLLGGAGARGCIISNYFSVAYGWLHRRFNLRMDSRSARQSWSSRCCSIIPYMYSKPSASRCLATHTRGVSEPVCVASPCSVFFLAHTRSILSTGGWKGTPNRNVVCMHARPWTWAYYVQQLQY